jgi:hypothetical protein
VQQEPELTVFLKAGLTGSMRCARKWVWPGYEGTVPLDFGDTGYFAKVPDIGKDPAFRKDLWRLDPESSSVQAQTQCSSPFPGDQLNTPARLAELESSVWI